MGGLDSSTLSKRKQSKDGNADGESSSSMKVTRLVPRTHGLIEASTRLRVHAYLIIGKTEIHKTVALPRPYY